MEFTGRGQQSEEREKQDVIADCCDLKAEPEGWELKISTTLPVVRDQRCLKSVIIAQIVEKNLLAVYLLTSSGLGENHSCSVISLT